MRKEWTVEGKEPVVLLGGGIVYGQRAGWCNAAQRPLKLSVMRSRQCFYYDREETPPVLLWLCGGGFMDVDADVWTPELAYFAKRGYAVVSVAYSVAARTAYPMQIEDVKLAIRYLRAHRAAYRLDTDRIVVMGESAGGYLCALAALSGAVRQYDVGVYQEQSSAVSGAVAFYPCTMPGAFDVDAEDAVVAKCFRDFPSLPELADEHAPPFLLLHGTADSQVPLVQSEALYDALTRRGVSADLIVLRGAEHADAAFFQPEVKAAVEAFLQRTIP